MMKYLFLAMALLSMQSCGLFRSDSSTSISGSDKEESAPLWVLIDNDGSKLIKHGQLRFKLDRSAFIDSFINYAKSDNTSEELLLMPLPNFSGYLDDFAFRALDNPQKEKHPEVYGFIGTNKHNKKDIATLYIDKRRLMVRWDSDDKDWELRAWRDPNDTSGMYLLVDMQKFMNQNKTIKAQAHYPKK